MARNRGLGEVWPGSTERFFIEWWHDSPTRPVEHNARAMLMGRYYEPTTHDYRVYTASPVKAADAPIDADTLEHYTGRRKKWRDRFQMENGLTGTQLTFVIQAAYCGCIAWPAREH